jgi:hypothetical protein
LGDGVSLAAQTALVLWILLFAVVVVVAIDFIRRRYPENPLRSLSLMSLYFGIISIPVGWLINILLFTPFVYFFAYGGILIVWLGLAGVVGDLFKSKGRSWGLAFAMSALVIPLALGVLAWVVFNLFVHVIS